MEAHPSVEMLIFQTTPFCNIDCNYCYLPHRQSKARLDPSIVADAARQIASANWVGSTLSVVWHAGEPLAVGAEHLNRLIDACGPLNDVTRVLHHVQTNATLLNDAFCDLFKRQRVRVGISIDGPQYVHDVHRITRGKTGTHDKVMRGVQLLREHNIAFSVICVVTSASVDKARELYTFFEELGAASVGFNIDEVEGTNLISSMDEAGFLDRVAVFWKDLFQVHFERRAFVLREADTLVSSIRHSKPGKVHNQQATPFAILAVSVDGAVGTFSPELLGQHHDRFGNFSIGQISSEPLNGMAHNPRFLAMTAEVAAGVSKCATECSYFELCGGGAPSNKLFENGTFDSTSTNYCRAIKMSVIDALLSEARRHKRHYEPINTRAASTIIRLPGVLDTTTCRSYLEKAHNSNWLASNVNGNGVSNRHYSPAQIDAAPIFAKIKSALPSQVNGLRIERIADDRAIFLRYVAGDCFPIHQDTPFRVDDRHTSIYTLVIYLNDDFLGGAASFPDTGQIVAPEAGMALLFPHDLRHEGLLIEHGTKYAIHTFVMYRG
ncbi:cyclophane-forming radical SAM/SPASM peptide maturase GrrM/OscB [Rhodoblastus sp.]|uniref:cyclophane-forming radical SAM/SPASM peptide maturase GrrM/OscB n=1 Tax=Rhodoblastus sp. TaxID=1962975 RepID=UPI003F977034